MAHRRATIKVCPWAMMMLFRGQLVSHPRASRQPMPADRHLEGQAAKGQLLHIQFLGVQRPFVMWQHPEPLFSQVLWAMRSAVGVAAAMRPSGPPTTTHSTHTSRDRGQARPSSRRRLSPPFAPIPSIGQAPRRAVGVASMVRPAGSPTATSTTHSSRDRGQASPTKRRRHSSHLTPTTWPCCHNGRCAGESPIQGIGQATTIAGASSPTTKGVLATTTPGGRRTAVRHRGDKDRAHPGTTVAEENQIPQETRFQNPQPCRAPGGVATGTCRHPG